MSEPRFAIASLHGLREGIRHAAYTELRKNPPTAADRAIVAEAVVQSFVASHALAQGRWARACGALTRLPADERQAVARLLVAAVEPTFNAEKHSFENFDERRRLYNQIRETLRKRTLDLQASPANLIEAPRQCADAAP